VARKKNFTIDKKYYRNQILFSFSIYLYIIYNFVKEKMARVMTDVGINSRKRLFMESIKIDDTNNNKKQCLPPLMAIETQSKHLFYKNETIALGHRLMFHDGVYKNLCRGCVVAYDSEYVYLHTPVLNHIRTRIEKVQRALIFPVQYRTDFDPSQHSAIGPLTMTLTYKDNVDVKGIHANQVLSTNNIECLETQTSYVSLCTVLLQSLFSPIITKTRWDRHCGNRLVIDFYMFNHGPMFGLNNLPVPINGYKWMKYFTDQNIRITQYCIEREALLNEDKKYEIAIQNFMDISLCKAQTKPSTFDECCSLSLEYGIKDLILHDFQVQNIQWMQRREQDPGDIYTDVWFNLPTLNSQTVLYAPSVDKFHVPTINKLPDVRGGMNFDGRGMGKTIQMIALINSSIAPLARGFAHRADRTDLDYKDINNTVGCSLIRPTTLTNYISDHEAYEQLTTNTLYIVSGQRSSCSPTATLWLVDDNMVTWTVDYINKYSLLCKAKKYEENNTDTDTDMPIIVCGYKMLPKYHIKNKIWHRIIADDAHILIKHSQYVPFMKNLKSTCKWVVSGTPLQESIYDMMTYVQWLEIFGFDDNTLWDYVRATNLTKLAPKARHICIKQFVFLMDIFTSKVRLHVNRQIFNDREKIVPSYNYNFRIHRHDIEIGDMNIRQYNNISSLVKSRTVQYSVSDKFEEKLQFDFLKLRKFCSFMKMSSDKFKQQFRPSGYGRLTTAKEPAITEQNEQCALCMYDFEFPIQLSCRHVFCINCIRESITKGNYDCPMCRAPLEYPTPRFYLPNFSSHNHINNHNHNTSSPILSPSSPLSLPPLFAQITPPTSPFSPESSLSPISPTTPSSPCSPSKHYEFLCAQNLQISEDSLESINYTNINTKIQIKQIEQIDKLIHVCNHTIELISQHNHVLIVSCFQSTVRAIKKYFKENHKKRDHHTCTIAHPNSMIPIETLLPVHILFVDIPSDVNTFYNVYDRIKTISCIDVHFYLIENTIEQKLYEMYILPALKQQSPICTESTRLFISNEKHFVHTKEIQNLL
jgi:hypothetical protein